jgi:hypothetical protein
LGKKVEDISANIYSIHLIFEQYQPAKRPRKNAGRRFQQTLNTPTKIVLPSFFFTYNRKITYLCSQLHLLVEF